MIQIALARPESYDFRPVTDAQVLRRPGGSERRKACTDHDTKYLVHPGQPGALVTLDLGASIIGLIAFGWWMSPRAGGQEPDA